MKKNFFAIIVLLFVGLTAFARGQTTTPTPVTKTPIDAATMTNWINTRDTAIAQRTVEQRNLSNLQSTLNGLYSSATSYRSQLDSINNQLYLNSVWIAYCVSHGDAQGAAETTADNIGLSQEKTYVTNQLNSLQSQINATNSSISACNSRITSLTNTINSIQNQIDTHYVA